MTLASSSPCRQDSTPITGAWRIDAEQSHARFVAATLRGAAKVRGAFDPPSGSLIVDDEGARGTLAIDAASVDTGNRLRDRHLRGRDFFGVAKHPHVRYELRSLTQGADNAVELDGDLVAAGTRTPLPLVAVIHLREDGGAELACRARIDRVELGVRGARFLVPREVVLDVAVVLRRGE
jgi:polyisoprenoid-binding protein YceI